ncbi:MAG: D-alanine--D-alanine ligase family protein, partial [Desulfohalobiaceae bacterium]
LGGHGRLIHVFPDLMEACGIPCTGAPAEALRATSDKIAAKHRLTGAGLPTPAWFGPYPSDAPGKRSCTAVSAPGVTWIVKSVWEHASLGLGPDALVTATEQRDLEDIIRLRAKPLGGQCFAEHYVEGREFNLSLLAHGNSPEVLPAAEIVFENFGPDRPRILDYRAKWEEGSFEYRHTPRRFDFPPQDQGLLEQLRELSLNCWRLFGLRGYARVDFRVDAHGRPFILEVNANPCLSPDAGYAAALEQAGIGFAEALERILEDVPSPIVEP